MTHVFGSVLAQGLSDDLVSGVFSDTLDKLGFPRQVVPGWQLNNARNRMLGRVRTLTVETTETSDERISRGLGFLSELGPDDALIIKGSDQFAYFGELMSRLSMELGIAGVAIDGLTRDSYFTGGIPLPVFARGYSPVDIKGRGRVDGLDVSVEIGGVAVNPGDFVFGDSDALVFIPERILSEVAARVDEGLVEEARIKAMIAEGQTVQNILRSVREF